MIRISVAERIQSSALTEERANNTRTHTRAKPREEEEIEKHNFVKMN